MANSRGEKFADGGARARLQSAGVLSADRVQSLLRYLLLHVYHFYPSDFKILCGVPKFSATSCRFQTTTL
jgi:hypothetical protein